MRCGTQCFGWVGMRLDLARVCLGVERVSGTDTRFLAASVFLCQPPGVLLCPPRAPYSTRLRRQALKHQPLGISLLKLKEYGYHILCDCRGNSNEEDGYPNSEDLDRVLLSWQAGTKNFWGESGDS